MSYSAPPPLPSASPQSWDRFESRLLGMSADVPPGYWVRLHGGVMLSIEQADAPATAAFLVPLQPRPGASAAQLAQEFIRLAQRVEPRFRGQVYNAADPAAAMGAFTSIHGQQPTEGRYCALLLAGGSLGFVIGVSAPAGRLRAELPVLEKVAQSIRYCRPSERWQPYRSPAGGFTMQIPPGWVVQSNDGQTGKSDIDMVAMDPRQPMARAFNLAPRFCSPQLLQDPLHALRGYQAAGFASNQQIAESSLAQVFPGSRLRKFAPNVALTNLGRQMMQEVAGILSMMGGAQVNIEVFDCVADAQISGVHVCVVCICAIRTMAIATFFGAAMDWEVTLRGWGGPQATFLNDSPVLDRVQNSFALTPAFIRQVVQGNEQAVRKISEVHQHMARVDAQIWQDHSDTQDAIAEMNYNLLTNNGGYVNENTGRIEMMAPDHEIRNSRGELVSAEEVIDQRIDPEQATVLREAFADDYMRGVHGRVQFT